MIYILFYRGLAYDGKIITARRVYDYEDKKIYNNAIECADSLNAAFVSIYNCCNHKIINKKHTTTDGEIVYYCVKGTFGKKLTGIYEGYTEGLHHIPSHIPTNCPCNK